MRLIIAGSRNATYRAVFMAFSAWVETHGAPSAVLCGGARGADRYGQMLAGNYGYPIEMFLPDWDNYGKRAGFLRNQQMAKYADALLAIWDGESKGTRHMIDIAKKQGLEVEVVLYGA
jgi:hypothetical protein